MLILGLLVAACALAFGVIVIVDDWGGPAMTVTALGSDIGHLTISAIFLAGVILTLIFCFALWLAGLSTRVHRRNRLRQRAELRETRAERERLAAERDRLASELNRRENDRHEVDMARAESGGADAAAYQAGAAPPVGTEPPPPADTTRRDDVEARHG